MMLRRLLTKEQVMEHLQVSKTWLDDQIRAGEIPVVRLGRAVRIEESDLQTYVERCKSSVVKTVGTISASIADATPGEIIQIAEKIVGAH